MNKNQLIDKQFYVWELTDKAPMRIKL